MGVLPIGFFSPLPLAIMIPFMATQSLAMGEAFGKSFQYGKRKISSMTNEEFNKYTFSDMMNEQTANVRAYIPKLHEQMELSYTLQIDIFQEMVKIIPAFFEALLKSLQPLATEFQQFNTTPFNQNIPIPDSSGTLVSATTSDAPTLISHENLIEEIPIIEIEKSKYSQAIFRAMPLDELIRGIQSGRFTGSDLSLAKHTLNTRQPPEEFIPSTTAKQDRQEAELIAWFKKRDDFQAQFIIWNKKYQFAGKNPLHRTTRNISGNKLALITANLKAMSNDYRNPNPRIQKQVLLLRKDIQSGAFKYKIF